MVNIAVRQTDQGWFGVAWIDDSFVATAIGASAEEARAHVTSCIARGFETRFVTGDSDFADAAARMLAELESGNEDRKLFTLSRDHLSGPRFRILTAAASIPIGYVSTYGTVADAARSEARAVGRAMATNPLYPIVPCHRVVGADFSMIGYGGSQDVAAISAKLGRLRRETRGYPDPREIELRSGILIVYPVEWVLETAQDADRRRAQERRDTAEREALESMQLRLF